MAPRSTPTRGSMPGSVAEDEEVQQAGKGRNESRGRRALTLVQDLQSRVVGTVKVLEEEWFAV